MEKRKAVGLKVADKVAQALPVVEAPAAAEPVAPDAVPVDKVVVGKVVNVVPVVREADRQ